MLGLIKHCILATDLALFFPNKMKLTQIVQGGAFSWANQDHRLLIQAIAMTASDLAASAKPWDIQVKTVKVIFEEFYEQGDAERNAGRIPIPMMDRNQPDQQAASQVKRDTSMLGANCKGWIREMVVSSFLILGWASNCKAVVDLM